jgi:hypothetical protein
VKRPLVLGASTAAVEQARALGVTRPLENVIEEAIIAGRLPGTSVGNTAPVALGDGVVAVCAKVKTQSGRKGWRPLAVRRLDRRRTA